MTKKTITVVSSKSRIRGYILILAAVTTILFTIVMTIGMLGLRDVSTLYWHSAVGPLYKDGEMLEIRLSIERTKRLNDNLFIHVGIPERVFELEREIIRNKGIVEEAVMEYNYRIFDLYEYDMMREVSELMADYFEMSAKMTECAKIGDIEWMDELISEIAPLEREIDSGLAQLSDMSRAMFEDSYYWADNRTNTMMILLITVSVFVLVIIIGAFAFVFFAAGRELSDKQETITYERY